ncbi:hypothetical protein BDY17DRAFT_313334 [Neohortaea acidophila]|uniref:Uncharacterized protein n=1 Tax=Neohortaea acidophila TaxID=245834 RepID=A0A6A6PHP8_9PEZI|nr:uncharacterized protein BDY17DRAFT_313334 [Neohortaea acidophila]KAF2479529.1 hypothetical protein BDY17DRAFT_313334 [Neohortaea acidophila]
MQAQSATPAQAPAPAPAPVATIGQVLAAAPPPPAERVTTATNFQSRIQNSASGYGDLIQGRPPFNAQPPLNVDITITEICTFFPSWFLLPEVAVRAVRNGWGRRDIAKAQLHAANLLDRENLSKAENRIQKQISDGGKHFCGLWGAEDDRWNSEEQRMALGQDDDLTANDWSFRPPKRGLPPVYGHVKLADLVNGVVNPPDPLDQGLVTKCIAFAASNPHLDLDTSHWDWVIQQLSAIGSPSPQRLNAQYDIQAVERLRANVSEP